MADALSRAPVQSVEGPTTDCPPDSESEGQTRVVAHVRNMDQPSTPGESVNHGDYVSSVGIVFSRKELFEAKQKDPFCQNVFNGLREPGGKAAAHIEAAGIAVSVQRLETAGSTVSTLDSYVLDPDGILLRYIPS